MKMKKWQKNMRAYAWSSRLLPDYIKGLKEKLKNSDDDGDQMSLKVKINQAEEDLEITEEEYKRLTNG